MYSFLILVLSLASAAFSMPIISVDVLRAHEVHHKPRVVAGVIASHSPIEIYDARRTQTKLSRLELEETT
ncbi:hypothetical protein C8R43DRAFT_1138509 [Mycena crocata]|nr:hypothetical protein C8R43DRAFT_1138509 [Mycena crocata]